MRARRRVALLLALAAAAGCRARNRLELDYQLAPGIAPASVARLETFVDLAPGGGAFTQAVPLTQAGVGVFYEVRDFDGSGALRLRVTHGRDLGFVFSPSFRFTLLPPDTGAAPKLRITANAFDRGNALVGHTEMALDGAFAEGATLPVPIADLLCGGTQCPDGQSCCNGACSDTTSDALNCGGCGMACGAGESCVGSACGCAGGPACGAGQTCCPMVGCIDTTSDPSNCGGCGATCKPGETCQGSQCRCGAGAACGAGTQCCNGACTATCACGTATCTAAQTCCAGACKDTTSDGDNCGSCGNRCTVQGTSCTASQCRCSPSGVACTGSSTCCGTTCTDLSKDAKNCGQCGRTCNPGEQCLSGNCRCAGQNACDAGQTCCAAIASTNGPPCFDLNNDPAHCGACTAPSCNPYANVCASGKCVCKYGLSGALTCSTSQVCCVTSLGASCTDFTSCTQQGGCPGGCPGDQHCCKGACINSGDVCLL